MLNYDEMYNELEKTQSLLIKEIQKINAKNDLTPQELNNMKEAVCLMKDIIKLDSMIEDVWNDEGYNEEYSEYYDEPTYRKDKSYARGRDLRTGRYVSREHIPMHTRSMHGMSRHSLNDRMVANLESMMDSAGSDFERKKIGEWIDKIRSSPET